MAASVSSLALAATASAPALTATANSPASAQDTGRRGAAGRDDIVVTGIRGSIRASIDAKRDSDVDRRRPHRRGYRQVPRQERRRGAAARARHRHQPRVRRRRARLAARHRAQPHQDLGQRPCHRDRRLVHPRQLAATRSFNYLTLPAEIVGQLDVYKSPRPTSRKAASAARSTSTPAIRSISSLHVSASVQGVYSELRRQDRSAGIGPGQLEERGRDLRHPDRRRLSEARHPPRRRRGARLFNPRRSPAGADSVPSLIGSALFQQERERYGGNIGIQFRPSDRSRSTSPGSIRGSARTISTRTTSPGAPWRSAAAAR